MELRRGRPSDDYPRDEFRKLLNERAFALNVTVPQLAARAGVNRGTVSQVLRGLRACAREDRKALMRALKVESDQQQRFLPLTEARDPELVLYEPADPLSGPHLPIQQGRVLLMRSMFPEARRQLSHAFTTALARRDLVRAADAAEVMAWLELEAMDREGDRVRSVLAWVSRSINLIEKQVGARLDQILDSVQAGSHSAVLAAEDAVTPILSKVLHIRSKVLTERVVYYAETHRRASAEEAFAQSFRLDTYRKVAVQLGHDFRWQAMLLADKPEARNAAERRISEGFDNFDRGSAGEALVARDHGVVYWQTGRPARARHELWKAVDLLAAYAEARGLGPAFYVLSKLASDANRPREARRLALIGAALHPYGFVLENSQGYISDGRELLRDLDDLRAGKPPFQVIHQVLGRLTSGTAQTAGQLIERNLSRVV